MIRSLRLKNFKAWKDTGEVRLAPLTIIFGANSAGKSSLGHLLLALKQTALSTDRKRALHLGDSNTLVDLGTFADCLHGHGTAEDLEFSFRWTLSDKLEIINSKESKPTKYIGDELAISVLLQSAKNEQPLVKSFEYQMFQEGAETLTVRFSRNDKDEYELSSQSYRFTLNQGRKWPIEPEKFYRVSDSSIARYQNADFLVDFALAVEKLLGNLFYLGPLRESPKRIYQWSGETPEDVGYKGERSVPALLAAQAQGRKLNRGPRKFTKDFATFIAEWLTELGIIHSFEVKPVAAGRKEYEVLIKSTPASPEVKLTDVGVGVSQVLPAVVQAFYAPPEAIIWMEQPEIHLHPQAQSALADVFASAIKSKENGQSRNVQFIIESHSEHFLTRIQRRIAEGTLTTDDVAVYFCKSTKTGACLEELIIDVEGNIANWPENFFGDEMGDAMARTEAALNRRMAGPNS